MYTLGLSFGYHDASAALVLDGRVIAAAAEERFTRQKHDSNFPNYAIKYCLERAGIDLGAVDRVVYHESPGQKFSRVLCSGLSAYPFSRREFTNSMKSWLGTKLWTINLISKKLDIAPDRIESLNHHFSHAATAFLSSAFEEAAILIVDAVGEWASTALYRGAWKSGKPSIERLRTINFPNSLGLVYSAITAYLGLNPNDNECSTMALAAFGKPVYMDAFREIVSFCDDGTYQVDGSYFNFVKFYEGSCSARFIDRFGPPRDHQDELPFDCFDAATGAANLSKRAQHFADMAATVQCLYETYVKAIAQQLHAETGLKNLCIGGGSALNCVANTRIVTETSFEDFYIPPDPGDGGSSIGAALYVNAVRGGSVRPGIRYSPYLGKYYDEEPERKMLEFVRPASFLRFKKRGTERSRHERWGHQSYSSESELVSETANELQNGKIVGWFQGGFEIGPRALGNRSILIRPGDSQLAKKLSARVKDRAPYRPYALSISNDEAVKVLEVDDLKLNPLRWMQLAVKVRSGYTSRVRAGLHIDDTTRPQVCFAEENPRYYALLKAFGKLSGLEVLLNTSFNEGGYPMAASPVLALVMFARTEMDVLVVNNLMVRKIG